MNRTRLSREDTVAVDRLGTLAEQPNTELEIRFNGVVTEWTEYRKVLTAIEKLSKTQAVTERSMTVSNKNENTYVSGITRFEKVYNLKDPAREAKSGYVFKRVTGSHEIRWLNLRVVTSLEDPLPGRPEDAKFNTFRYRVRQSVVYRGWRYDFTRILSLDLDLEPASRARTWTEECHALPIDAEWPCRYELEAERIDPKSVATSKSGLAGEILEDGGPVMVVYQAAGRNLTKILIDNTVFPLIREWIPGVRNFRDLMNKPVPLTRERMQHLTEELYAASLKADGERVFIFAAGSLDQVYVIKAAGTDPIPYRLEAPNSGHPDEPEVGTYLIDAEMDGDRIWMFECLVFMRNTTEHRFQDRYEQIRDKFTNYRLVPAKSELAEKKSWADLAEETFMPMSYTLDTKEWLFSKNLGDIYNLVQQLSKGRRMDGKRDAKAGFGIDGVMLQPNDSGYYNKRTYKWKPPEMNSIDFLVRVTRADPQSATLRLYVGASLIIYERHTHNKGFDTATFPRLSRTANYGPMPFVVPGGQQMNTTVVPRNVMEIEDDSIYEFVYRQTDKDVYGWVPLRLREDRTAEYRKGTFFGNNYDVACEAWETIRNPIPLESLTNPVRPAQAGGAGYWARPGTPSRTGIGRFTGMVNTDLFTTYVKAGNRLLEVSGGRGGNINRWKTCRVSQVTNIDQDQAAIDEMYSRLNELYRVNPELRESMPVNGVVANVLTTDFQGEFDVVCCMFAIHYFLRNEADFTRFYNLVDRCLVRGGIVLITSLDGARVMQSLASHGQPTPTTENPQARTLTLGPAANPVATIRAPKPLGARIRDYGQQIGVRVSSIGEEHLEYLVNYNFVQKFFRTRGYSILQSKPFEQITRRTDQRLTADESSYISMARYLVLQKKA